MCTELCWLTDDAAWQHQILKILFFWSSTQVYNVKPTLLVIRVAPDIISGPAPAEIRPNFHMRPYRAGYGHRIWGRILPSFHASASLCNWAGIHCSNSVICTSLFQWACGNDVMIQQFGGSTPKIRYQASSKVAQIYLAPPPTSVPSERLFSVAGDVTSEHCARLNSENAEKLIF